MHCQIEADWLHSWGSLTRSTFELLICFECRLLTGNSQLEDPNSFHFPSLGGCCSNYWDLFKGNFYIKGTGCEEMKLKESGGRKVLKGFRWKRGRTPDPFRDCSTKDFFSTSSCTVSILLTCALQLIAVTFDEGKKEILSKLKKKLHLHLLGCANVLRRQMQTLVLIV